MITRRGFLGGLLAAPAIIKIPGLLMPVKAWSPPAHAWVPFKIYDIFGDEPPADVSFQISEDGSIAFVGLNRVVERQMMQANLYGTSWSKIVPSDL